MASYGKYYEDKDYQRYYNLYSDIEVETTVAEDEWDSLLCKKAF